MKKDEAKEPTVWSEFLFCFQKQSNETFRTSILLWGSRISFAGMILIFCIFLFRPALLAIFSALVIHSLFCSVRYYRRMKR